GHRARLRTARWGRRSRRRGARTDDGAALGIFDGVDTPVDRTGAPLSLMTVHAHPDDEASKGSATVARYADEGVRTSLVCCTGGEAGDILNPAVDTPEVRADLFR